jgi:hypothetical protein
MDNEHLKSIVDSLSPEQVADLLQQILKQQSEKNEKPTYKRNPQTSEKNDNSFVMKQEQSKVRKTPVTEGRRFNKFKDTGEHRDEVNKTPEVNLTERRRPTFKQVDQVCTRCNKKVQVHPQHARDFYVCDS